MMITTKIKICGLSRPEDIEAANRLEPDFIGFVFAKSRRRVTKEQAGKLKAMTSPGIKAVGVFVDAQQHFIEGLVRDGVIDLVQLHGHEDEHYIHKLRQEISCPVIRAVRVKNTQQILEADRLPVDYLLLDTYVEGEMGGSGTAFDWSMIPQTETPYFLAGGLSCGNINAALSACTPFAVDISSGVETNGFKDAAKMSDFIRRVRA